jgi:hypothetical protein
LLTLTLEAAAGFGLGRPLASMRHGLAHGQDQRETAERGPRFRKFQQPTDTPEQLIDTPEQHFDDGRLVSGRDFSVDGQRIKQGHREHQLNNR